PVTTTWTNGAGTFIWPSSSNWSPSFPLTGDTAVFGNTGVGTISLGGTGQSAATVIIQNTNPAAYDFVNGSIRAQLIKTASTHANSISGGVTDPTSAVFNDVTFDLSSPLTVGSVSITSLLIKTG